MEVNHLPKLSIDAGNTLRPSDLKSEALPTEPTNPPLNIIKEIWVIFYFFFQESYLVHKISSWRDPWHRWHCVHNLANFSSKAWTRLISFWYNSDSRDLQCWQTASSGRTKHISHVDLVKLACLENIYIIRLYLEIEIQTQCLRWDFVFIGLWLTGKKSYQSFCKIIGLYVFLWPHQWKINRSLTDLKLSVISDFNRSLTDDRALK